MASMPTVRQLVSHVELVGPDDDRVFLATTAGVRRKEMVLLVDDSLVRPTATATLEKVTSE
jgi:glutamine phosphoribosylpyrophosphate amidotransferase